METHSAAQQGEGVAVAVAVAVVAADKQRQQQHYTHHYVERFSVIDDMGPLRDPRRSRRSAARTTAVAACNASLAERGRKTIEKTQTQTHTNIRSRM